MTTLNLSAWFSIQLQTSFDGFAWGVEQVPSPRRNTRPPDDLGEWTAARHIYHMLSYEQRIALPSMRQWLGDACPSTEGPEDDVAWTTRQPDVDSLLAEFATVRAEQIALLPLFADTAWNAPRQAVWGPVSLLWVVSKTFQHTAEHTSDVMRIALFWEAYAARPQAAGAA